MRETSVVARTAVGGLDVEVSDSGASDLAVAEASIAQLRKAYRDGKLTASSVVSTCRRRIDAYDSGAKGLNAVVRINEDALEVAKRLDTAFARTGRLAGPLHGIPVLVKDQIETAGLGTSFGSVAMADFVPERDATVVRRLKNAGAIVLAKTTMADFGTSWFSLSSLTGFTRNPYDPTRDPGGSSSGSAAGVTAGFAPVGIGEDTGGSIRVPAAFTNLVGVRVTVGLISRNGVSPLVAPQDTPGPLTRTVEDAAILLDVLVGYDEQDELTGASAIARATGHGRTYTESLGHFQLEGSRIGVLVDARPQPSNSVSDVFDAAVQRMASSGATIENVRIPRLQAHLEATDLYLARSAADINAFLRQRTNPPLTVERLFEEGKFDPSLDLFAAIVGAYRSSSHEDLQRRQLAQLSFQRSIVNVIARHRLDALCFPTVRVPPPKTEDLRQGRVTTQGFPTNTVIASQSGLPAISIPAGFTDDGMPVGLELLGLPYHEHSLLGLAARLEERLQSRMPPFPVVP